MTNTVKARRPQQVATLLGPGLSEHSISWYRKLPEKVVTVEHLEVNLAKSSDDEDMTDFRVTHRGHTGSARATIDYGIQRLVFI